MHVRHAVVESPNGSLRRTYYKRFLSLSIGLGLAILQNVGMSAPALAATSLPALSTTQSLPAFDRELLKGKSILRRLRSRMITTKSPAGAPKATYNASYRFSTINYPSATGSEAFAVNDFGRIGGIYSTAATGGQAFGFVVKPPYSVNGYSSVNPPNSSETLLYGINNFGNTAGSYYDAQENEFGFVQSGNTFTSYAHPNTSNVTELFGLNDRGFAVGVYNAGSAAYGFILNLKTGKYVDLVPPGPSGTSSIAFGINDLNVVVGSVLASTGIQVAFTYQNSQFHEFSYPNAMVTQAMSINNLGEIVGQYALSDGIYHGFALKNGKFTTVDDPNNNSGDASAAYGVNDLGAIVGTYENGGQVYGYLATPK